MTSTVSERYDGKQPLPAVNKREYVQNLVRQDIADRLEFGIGKYGSGLQAYNGRDALQDLYDELLDAVCYLRQALEEQRNPVDGVHTKYCDACMGAGLVQPRQSMVSYVLNEPKVCTTCGGSGWVYVE